MREFNCLGILYFFVQNVIFSSIYSISLLFHRAKIKVYSSTVLSPSPFQSRNLIFHRCSQELITSFFKKKVVGTNQIRFDARAVPAGRFIVFRGRLAGQYNAPGGVISRGAPLNLFAHDDIGIGRNNWIRWPNNIASRPSC
jgi:hypothetical protein